MPADKDAAKRRRQARNRQERENRQARTEGAKRAASRPARTASDTPPVSVAKGGGRSKGGRTTTTAAKGKDGRPSRTLSADEAAPARSGGLLGSLLPPRQPAGGGEARPGRPARVPSQVVEVDVDPGVRGYLQRWSAQPGGRPALLALLAAVVAALSLIALPVLPSYDLAGYGEKVVTAKVEAEEGADASTDDALAEMRSNPTETVRALELKAPQVYLVLMGFVVPILLASTAIRSLLRPTRSRTMLVCAIAGAMFVLLQGSIPFLLVAAFLGWGAWQSSKADKAAAAAS